MTTRTTAEIALAAGEACGKIILACHEWAQFVGGGVSDSLTIATAAQAIIAAMCGRSVSLGLVDGAKAEAAIPDGRRLGETLIATGLLQRFDEMALEALAKTKPWSA